MLNLADNKYYEFSVNLITKLTEVWIDMDTVYISNVAVDSLTTNKLTLQIYVFLVDTYNGLQVFIIFIYFNV